MLKAKYTPKVTSKMLFEESLTDRTEEFGVWIVLTKKSFLKLLTVYRKLLFTNPFQLNVYNRRHNQWELFNNHCTCVQSKTSFF